MTPVLRIALLTVFAGAAMAGEFPIGVYSLHPRTDEHAENVKRFGVDMIQDYGANPYDETRRGRVDEMLALAVRHGQKLLLRFYPPKNEEEEAKVDDIIARYKDHPGLGMWYIYDEPRKPELLPAIEKHYRRLKTLSPDVPVAMAVNWVETYTRFIPFADVLMPDGYPVASAPFPEASLRSLAYFLWTVKRHGKTVMPIAQLSNLSLHPNEVKRLKGEVATARDPERREMRYLIFSLMAMDVQGMFFFCYHDLYETKRMSWFDHVGGPALAELRAFAARIEGAAFTPLTGELGKGKREPEVMAARWEKGGRSMLALVNNSRDERPGPFPLATPLADGALKPWGATRQPDAAIRDGAVRLDRLLPWEVMLWEY